MYGQIDPYIRLLFMPFRSCKFISLLLNTQILYNFFFFTFLCAKYICVHEMRLIAKIRGIKVTKPTSKTELFRVLKKG